MITPIVPAAAVIAAAKPASYLRSFMEGIIKEPIAETVAGPDPEIDAKNMQARTVTIASPPTMKPTRLSAKATRRREIPPLHISAPARMKKGMASRGNESSPVTDFCASIIMGISDVNHIAMAVEIPSVMPIGTLRAIVTSSKEKRIIASMTLPPYSMISVTGLKGVGSPFL
jgi:hypothetical protein